MPFCPESSLRTSPSLKILTQWKQKNVTDWPWTPCSSAFVVSLRWLPRQTTAAARPKQEEALLRRSSKPPPLAWLCQFTPGHRRPRHCVVQKVHQTEICQKHYTQEIISLYFAFCKFCVLFLFFLFKDESIWEEKKTELILILTLLAFCFVTGLYAISMSRSHKHMSIYLYFPHVLPWHLLAVFSDSRFFAHKLHFVNSYLQPEYLFQSEMWTILSTGADLCKNLRLTHWKIR